LHETMDDWDKENFGEGFELKKEITSAEQAWYRILYALLSADFANNH
jgi:hypothetical protein